MVEVPVLRKNRCMSVVTVDLTQYENGPISGHTSQKGINRNGMLVMSGIKPTTWV